MWRGEVFAISDCLVVVVIAIVGFVVIVDDFSKIMLMISHMSTCDLGGG